MTLTRDVFRLFGSTEAWMIASIDVTERDSRGRTALHLLVENPMDYALPIAESMIPIVEKLLQRGADRHSVDNSGRKPVDLVEAWAKDCVPGRDRYTLLAMLA
ncbi:hypothetical protein Q9L58_006964 [Maublancomyces gigas]|uniref:Uncharacterized protein n=1 Tax=Discina gigas TaxID=1032678 RepID=A0ABR3GDV5_9PEZI